MTSRRRIALKLAWMFCLVLLLVTLSATRFDFVYRAF